MDFDMGMDTTCKVMMTLALGGLAVSGLCFLAAFAAPYVKAAWDRASKFARAVFCGAAVGAVLFGGAKNGATGKITYPKTDNEIAYLTDAGSYVTNDAVHVAFTRLPMVPSSATFYLDYCALDATNSAGVATNWVNAKTATFADLTVPFDFAFANATNYNWLAYTDWTPGPAVQTNGVWHAYWGIDKKEGRYFIPVRTCVRDGGEVIATPKSKWDAPKTPDDYVQDGLVAMWDGEWNAGRGVHDDAATTWKDLIGSRDLTMLDMTTSSRCWEKNCAYTDYGNLTYYSSSAIAEARAIECVYMPTKYGSSYAGTLVMNNSVDASTEAQGYVVIILTRFHNRSGVDGLQVAYDKFAYFDTKSVFNTIYTYTAQYSTVYRNAVGFEVQTMSGDSWSGKTISIAGRDTYTTYTSPGRFYCIRIYNRELTAEEVAHNYAIDKARFGSGNE